MYQSSIAGSRSAGYEEWKLQRPCKKLTQLWKSVAVLKHLQIEHVPYYLSLLESHFNWWYWHIHGCNCKPSPSLFVTLRFNQYFISCAKSPCQTRRFRGWTLKNRYCCHCNSTYNYHRIIASSEILPSCPKSQDRQPLNAQGVFPPPDLLQLPPTK